MIRRTVFYLVLILLTSNIVIAYGLGVSPAEDTVCVIPGQIKNYTFYVSKTLDVTEGNMEVYLQNLSWLYAQQYLELPEPNKMSPLNVTIYTPKQIEYGMRTGELLVCAPPKASAGSMPIQPCVEALLHVDVQETCPEIEEQKEYFKNLASDILMAAIFILLILYLCRRVTRTKCRTKEELRRIKRRKKTKRRKK